MKAQEKIIVPPEAAPYLARIMNPTTRGRRLEILSAQLKEACEYWKEKGVTITHVMGTGTSGTVAASMVAALSGLGLVVLRKSRHDGQHSSNLLECSWSYLDDTGLAQRHGVGEYNVLAVDDLVSSGNTLDQIITACKGHGLNFRGGIFYSDLPRIWGEDGVTYLPITDASDPYAY